ncbi:GrpB family protein [Kribbella sp. VKM Ac-2568]|uniref:GrpB family protein n=1 Tax=Kribbella sp. VKM Ac-2568 TaxID=2512219 RepID=UPI00104A8E76|nr:GrpB family protein [Kribbella sp. VKM Ac-2568]TCM47763.1 GrpB protein [Kribbella sp. VKM Ac-2568]
MIWSDTITTQAARIHQQIQADLTAAAIPGELLWTGASSLPGLLTKGDVDLHLRVPTGTFDEVVAALDVLYPRASLHSWASTLAVFDIPDRELPTGLAVTPVNSEHDHRFTHAWRLLANDPALRAQYNALKQNAGDPETYESEKSAFFSRLTNT